MTRRARRCGGSVATLLSLLPMGLAATASRAAPAQPPAPAPLRLAESFAVTFPAEGGSLFKNMMHGVTVGDVNGDGLPEIFALRADGRLYGVGPTGRDLPGFPLDLVRLAGATMANSSTGHQPALGDLDGDGDIEIVAGVRLQTPREDGRLFVLDARGRVDPAWPAQGVSLGPILASSPTLADLDHDGDLEIVLGGGSLALRRGELYVLQHDGSFLDPRYPLGFPGIGFPNDSTVAIGDLDRDGDDDMVFVGGDFLLHAIRPATAAELPGFPVSVEAFRASVALGDLDGDGALEIAVVEDNAVPGKVSVLDAGGMRLPGWPRSFPDCGCAAGSPSLADLDGDGRLEVIVGSYGLVSVYRTDGSPLPGWPRAVDSSQVIAGNVTVGDLDGDGRLDVVRLGSEGTLWAWDATGQLLPGMPMQLQLPGFATNCWATPVLTDLRRDGDADIVFSIFFNASFGIGPHFAAIVGIDRPSDGLFPFTGAGWPAFQVDARHSGLRRR